MSDGQQINPVEVLTKSISGIEKSLEKNSEAISKMVEMQTSQVENAKSKEEIEKSMEEKMEAKVAEIQKSYNEKLQEHDLKFEEIEKSSRKQGKMSGEENTSILEKAEVKDAIAKSISCEKAQIDCDVFKSLVSYNNTSVGALQREMRNLGEVDINLQTSSPVVNLVNIVTSSSIKGVVYDTIYTSVLPPQEVLEGMSIEQKKDIIKRGQIDIQPEKVKAWNYITDTVIHCIRAGEYRSNPIDAELRALDVQLSKQIARKILNGKVVSGKGIQGILPKALTFPSNQVVPTQQQIHYL